MSRLPSYPKNSASLREIKKGLILKLILSGGKYSGAELGRALNVGRSTVLHVIRELKAEGLVEETVYGETTGKGGRRPLELGIKSDSNFIISLCVRGNFLRASVIDFKGATLMELKAEADIAKGAEALVKKMTSLVIKLRAAFLQQKTSANFLACGISFSGRVDPEKGMVLFEHNFMMRNFPVCNMISTATGLPVYIDNRVVIGGIAEKWFGRAKELKNFVYFQVLPSMRSVVFLDGKPFRGINHMAGEVGAIPLADDEKSFICDIMDTRIFKLPGISSRTGLWDSKSIKNKPEALKSIRDFLNVVDDFKYTKSDMDIVIGCAKKLLGSFISFYDPETIIFSGVPDGFHEYFISEMKKSLQSSMYMVPPENYKLEMAPVLANRTELGIIGMIIERILSQA